MEPLQRTVTSSDDSSLEPSTGPTSPEWSPFIPPQSAGSDLEARLARMHYTGSSRASDGNISEILGPAALAEKDLQSTVRNVCVIGAGYVGGPTAAVLALHNPSVSITVLDRDGSRIAKWQSPHLPIHEPGLDPVVRLTRDGGEATDTASEARKPNLFFSTSTATAIGAADLIFLAVNTPTKISGRGAGQASDLSALEGAVRDVAQFARPGTILVEKSTVPCGTANLIDDILTSLRPEDSFPILSNPEFLAEGSAIRNLLHPDRVLIGAPNSVAGRRAAARLARLYASWIPEAKILHTNVWSSELAKLVANAMLAQRISSINSISAVCERTGADVREIARAVGLDARIGSRFLQSGLGFGGSCFRKDICSLVYIAESLHLPEVAEYWKGVLTINEYQRGRFGEKIVRRLNNTLVRKKVTLLGFAYKKDTGDTRESLAVDVIKTLVVERPGEIAIFDPCCPKEGIERELLGIEGMDKVKVYSDMYEACQGASAIGVLTEWDLFKCDQVLHGKSKEEEAKPVKPAPKEPVVTPAEAPLKTYTPPAEPPCPGECSECVSHVTSRKLLDGRQRMDWKRVISGLKEPKYVLDGRGILDEQVMQQLGVRVEGLGWGSVFSSHAGRW